MRKCLICESEYQPFVDFGDMPIANAFATKKELEDEYTFPMRVGFCESCNMVQLVEQPDREKMFHENYAFFSSTSNYMKEHFKRFANSVSELQVLDENSFVVEIGSNDGIMLQNFLAGGIPCLGVEFVDNRIMNQLSYEVSCDKFKDKGFNFTGSLRRGIEETISLLHN